LWAVACGDVAYDNAQGRTPEGCPPTAGGEQGTPDELSELLAELLAPRICEQVVGTFVGLPGDETHDGPAAGLDPSVGRWWIRQCQADVQQGRVRVAIGGPGWTWLDRESSGFRVRQYLRFDATATFAASLRVGYDARTRVATVWLRPAPGVTAQVQPQGLVRAEATGIFSAMLGGFLDLTGSSASDRARAQAAAEGSQRLRDRLSTGFTVTYSLGSEQMDFLLGELGRGQVPERPWPTSDRAWLVNERSAVWPGGIDVVGPMAEDAGAVTLDVELEQGQTASVRRVCAQDLSRWLDAAWSGQPAGGAPGDVVAELASVGQPRTVALEARSCRAFLLVTPGAQATLPSLLRYRVLAQGAGGGPRLPIPGTASPAPTTAPQYGISASPVTPLTPSVRVEVRTVSVAAQNAGGGSWDLVGGDADPYVVVISVARRRELDRTPPADDAREARFDRVLPAAVSLDDFPLRFMVYDEDVTSDELIGVADVEPSALRGITGAVELALPLRTEGATPVVTGTLRVRFVPVQ
jgi:hypothetical protein